MSTCTSLTRAGCFTAVMTVASAGCGIIGPTCTDETGAVLDVSGSARESQIVTYNVISPKNSNLLMRLTWPDTAATLRLSATTTACGTHPGCRMDTLLPTFGPGGPSPIPQPWPPGLREMQVDGSKGKTYRVEIASDSLRDVNFALKVTYQISCER